MFPFPIDNIIMIAVGLALITVGIKKEYEPLLLLPIGFGCVLINLPFSILFEPGQVLQVLYTYGIETELFPILLFIGIGAMCDFGYILERPWIMVFAAAGQIGIFVTLNAALALGFPPLQAASIGIIGAMDGPTAIYVTSTYAPEILPAVVVCAYSYMSMVPIIMIPVVKALTTKKERMVRMEIRPKAYSKAIRIIFPLIIVVITGLIAPMGLPLMGFLMFGNFLRESGVVQRLVKTSENEIANITTLFLGITIGGTMAAERFLRVETLLIFCLGIVAFVAAISIGVLFGKILYVVTKGKVNPIVGACGISAFPMAGRTAHLIARKDDPFNYTILMNATGANTAGQIASVIAGGVILTYAPQILGMV
jgi:sodium ion-translocating decarboxylase beta subunit